MPEIERRDKGEGKLQQVAIDGDLDRGIWSAGMVVGLIDDIPTCEELIERIVGEAESIGSRGSLEPGH